ncbi:response regulator [Rariglobus hedericola]|uniref:response regulator n=1 Tax=Rariglobus hedericola TaxID=2597822 RepID=UPI0011821714|nr:response regulator [Rariglobus hedericola]
MEDQAGKAIVIVDDEMSFTDLLGRLLGEHFQCPILTFSNPVTALETIPLLDIGMLVTDYYMPHLNGIELIRGAIARSAIAPPCVLITGHALDEDSDIARMACFKGILAKPFRWQQLASLIEQHWPADAPSPLRPGAVSLHR